MTFNLIEERWIPVRRRSGTRGTIAPWEVTEGWDADPIVRFDACRPEFNGALAQFLIGLVQSTGAPKNDDGWADGLDETPKPDALHKTFGRVRKVFDLDGGERRFLQDMDIQDAEPGSVHGLLFGTPGEQTTDDNKDLFIKRRPGFALCLPCAAQALLAYQVNGPAGGKGYRTSLRGGGPITTLVLGKDLWRTVWLNVLPSDARWLRPSNPGLKEVQHTFPWMGPTRTSEEGGTTTPSDGHPLQAFWSMSHRLLLGPGIEQPAPCGTCGDVSRSMIAQVRRLAYGTNYNGAWVHPLSPFFTGAASAKKVPSAPALDDSTAYRHWLGLVIPGKRGKDQELQPAPVVQRLQEVSHEVKVHEPRLWAFGFWMKSAKVLAWTEGIVPLVLVAKERREVFEATVGQLVRSADDTRYQVMRAVLNATPDPGGDLSSERMDSVRHAFWANTEPAFYAHLERMAGGSSPDSADVRASWHQVLRYHALAIFDAATGGVPIGHTDAGRVVRARRSLRSALDAGKVAKELAVGVALPSKRPAKSRTKSKEA